MNILFIGKSGESLCFAMRVKDEEHNEYLHITDKKYEKVGKDVVKKTCFSLLTSSGKLMKGNVKTLLKDVVPHLVVFNGVGFGEVAEYIHSEGICTFGSSKWSDAIEVNRQYRERLMTSVGIPTVSSKIEIHEENMIIDCKLWWNGITSYLHSVTINFDRFMNNNIGPTTNYPDSVSTLVSRNSKLVREGIGKIEGILKKIDYRGVISLTMVVNSNDIYNVSVKARLEGIQPILELYRGKFTELLYSTAFGNERVGEQFAGYAIAVHLSIPPYTSEGLSEPTIIKGVSKKNDKHIWMNSIRGVDEGYESVYGNLLTVTARGETIRECRRRVYRTIGNLSIDDLQYRTDIGKTVELGKLKKYL